MAATAAAAGDAGGTAAATARASRFAAACGALSQIVKEATERTRAAPVRRPLPLMPGADVDAAVPDCQDEEAETAGPAPAQLTIVYGGRALVLDGVPADKAADLLRMAAAAARGGTAAPVAAADMPVARKASLQRFMEKRKGRLAARGAPYRLPGVAACPDRLTLAL